MTETNPFKAPETEKLLNLEPTLDEMDIKSLKKLVGDSQSVGCFGLISALVSIALLFQMPKMLSTMFEDTTHVWFFFGLTLLILIIPLAATAFGAFIRPNWARTLGILFSGLLILNVLRMESSGLVPTMIGILGLTAYTRGKILFGKERLTHAAIKAAYKSRKS